MIHTVDETVVDEGDDDLLITGLKEAFGEVLSVLCGLFGSSLMLEAGAEMICVLDIVTFERKSLCSIGYPYRVAQTV